MNPTNRLDGALSALKPGLDVNYDYLAGKFVGSTSQVASFYFLPPACLRLLDPLIDGNNHFIPDQYMMREGAALSSSEWILPKGTATMPSIYGPQPKHGWCYYFEKADLARQMGDWKQVAKLGDVAFALNDYPNDPSERFVFIEHRKHPDDEVRTHIVPGAKQDLRPHDGGRNPRKLQGVFSGEFRFPVMAQRIGTRLFIVRAGGPVKHVVG